MTFSVYDSARRAVVEFRPLVEGRVSMYCCGPTVQGAPHLGHVRKEVSFDVLRRWLEYCGYEVTLVANITDIDDKTLAKAAEAGVEWWAHAYHYELAFHAAYRALGNRPPSYEPRATGHIPDMIALIEQLIARGHAYAADDGSGDVYFDVRSWPEYGALSGQRLDDMEPAEDADPRGKRDPRDFALWKGTKPDEPPSAAWDSPWGPGRPGWHIECSAMAGRYLGDAFDIHGGGIDLRFPHHENELAQSRAAGRPFATYWMHNAWVTTAGEKMSKSLGNTADVAAAVARHGGRAVRLYLAGPHYRSAIELSDESLAEATTQLSRIDSFLREASEALGASAPARAVPAAFAEAMDNDLSTPGALAVLFNTIRRGNQARTAAAGGDRAALEELREAYASVKAMLGVFGLDPDAPEWAGGAEPTDDLRPVVDALVGTLLTQRAEARSRKDWATADAIRDSLARAGLKVEDRPDGARWSLAKE